MNNKNYCKVEQMLQISHTTLIQVCPSFISPSKYTTLIIQLIREHYNMKTDLITTSLLMSNYQMPFLLFIFEKTAIACWSFNQACFIKVSTDYKHYL